MTLVGFYDNSESEKVVTRLLLLALKFESIIQQLEQNTPTSWTIEFGVLAMA